jgi:MYXO-CTERM domain-containing protein
VAAVKRRLVLVALLLLGAGWAIAPHDALPLYDGVGFPDEPYRFVHAPKGAPDTKPPSTAHASAAVSGGRTSKQLTANSAEQAPQVSVRIPPGRLVVPSSTTRVSLTAAPAQPLSAPNGKYLWSNVYDVTTSPSASLHPGGLQATITMRAATPQQPAPKIAYYAAGHWTLLPTFATGRDIYIAELTQFGRFAVIGSKPLDVTQVPGYSSGSGGGSKVGLFVGIGALLVVVGLFLLGRWRRQRVRAEHEAADEEIEA